MWRELAAVNNLLTFRRLESSLLKMCSSCFNEYAKLIKLKSAILSKLEKAGEELKDAPPPSKRAKIAIVSESTSERSMEKSPSVMVNNINKEVSLMKLSIHENVIQHTKNTYSAYEYL